VVPSQVLPVLVAAVGAFVLSGAYYAALGGRMAALSPAYAGPRRSAAATALVEVVRNVVLAVVVAGLADGLGVDGVGPAVLLAVVLWVAFPLVLLTGSVFHERVPPLLATIHAGDWLLKLAVITGVVAGWG
jgi:hypothetical protein